MDCKTTMCTLGVAQNKLEPQAVVRSQPQLQRDLANLAIGQGQF